MSWKAAVSCACAAIALSACGNSAADDAALNKLQLNQLGFLPDAAKRAILVTDASDPVDWAIVDTAGNEMLQGRSSVFGVNAGSGEKVHLIEFGEFANTGEGYRLIADEKESRPFAIADDIYGALKYDALSYFYHNRASTPIEEEYVQGPQWARPAGHDPDAATCFDKTDQSGNDWPGCDYTLDASGGWYDAGDQGKYVVNGGISVWTLMNYYEREQVKGVESSAFADGETQMPENANGVNDLLDEARWELDFLMAMQVPEGTRLQLAIGDQRENRRNLKFTEVNASGMAHLKLTDEHWTPLPTAPHEDKETRYLYPPTTGATLNLAAVAAQCARIWKEIDADYSAKCLSSAKRAFDAALRNPDIHAIGVFDGGGGYGVGALSDEFYWATAELYITTGDEKYLIALRDMQYFLKGPRSSAGATGDIGWPTVGGLGALSLALLPSGITEAERAIARASIIEAADAYLEEAKKEGYVIPYSTEGYPWGSNAAILNRALVLAYAYEFTGETRYRNGVVDAMDYVLGRNPLDQSYVSGYGARPMQNPHHRFWAHQADPDYPGPPPGVLSGGANNTSMVDPIGREMRGKCRAQTCWRDHYEAYSQNEVAINWNAPLVWAAAFLDE